MKTFKAKKELMFVVLPKGAYDVEVVDNGTMIVWENSFDENCDYIFFPQRNWQLVGKLSDVSEEVARELVDDCPMFAKCWKHYGFVETERHTARTPDTSCNTAIKSLNSIATHLGLNLENNIYLLKKIN